MMTSLPSLRAREGDDQSDSSEDERERNARGPGIPHQWYAGFDHIGYDLAGQRVEAKGDGDAVTRLLLARGSDVESKEFRRSVYDEKNDLVTRLTDRELTMVQRLVQGRFPHPEFDAEPEYVDYYSGIKMQTSMRAGHEPKSKFVPSKWERMKLYRIVEGIKAGRIKINSPEEEAAKREEMERQRMYLMWGKDGTAEGKDEVEKRKRGAAGHIPAPKVALPGHAASYHPPPEYLPDDLTTEDGEEQGEGNKFVPKSYDTLRHVPAYDKFITERFERCLDLYLCPRTERVKLNIDPESLVPRLPLPRELRPFPTSSAVTYLGHTRRVRSISVNPTGHFLATGGDDGDLRVWEVESGRCLACVHLSSPAGAAAAAGGAVDGGGGGEDDNEPHVDDVLTVERNAVKRVEWNPKYRGVLAASCGADVVLVYFSPCPGTAEEAHASWRLLKGAFPQAAGGGGGAGVTTADCTTWSSTFPDVEEEEEGGAGAGPKAWALATHQTRISYSEDPSRVVTDLVWHPKGEFLCNVVTTPDASRSRVLVHHVGRAQTQDAGFATSLTRGDVQRVTFHPSKPILLVASRTEVIVYNLVKQELVKRLKSGLKWISSVAVHPGGDHVLCGSYDCRVAWFDLELSSSPFKTLKYHGKAVREVCFHRKYPLFASVADDGYINVFHVTVYDDLTTNPLIVPVKRIEAHSVVNARGVASVVFHPIQPWVFTCGADGLGVMFTNVD